VCPKLGKSHITKKKGQHFHDLDNPPSIFEGNMFNVHPFPTNPWEIFLPRMFVSPSPKNKGNLKLKKKL